MTPFVADKRLTAIALGFRNAGFIADQIAPRADTPGTRGFKWTEYKPEEAFTIPETQVSRKGRPTKVEFTAEEKDSSVLDYGLSDDIPMDDIEQAKAHPAFDPEGMATLKMSELVALDREKRVADMIMNPASYNHKETISGTDLWTHPDADPLIQLGDAMQTPLVRPNTLTLGQHEAWLLRKHPNIIKAYNGTLGDKGLVPLDFIREALGLSQILVGESRYNAAKPGQPMTLTQLWSGGASLTYNKPAAQLKNDVTFAITATWGGRVAHRQVKAPGELGLRGGVTITVGDSVRELIMSNEAGYFLDGVAG